MHRKPEFTDILLSGLKVLAICIFAFIIAYFTASRTITLARAKESSNLAAEFESRITTLEKQVESTPETQPIIVESTLPPSPLTGKKIIYDGDSITESRENNGGGYAAIIAERYDGTYENFASGGARLCSSDSRHSVVDNLENLPADGDLYCFQAGINDYWGNTPIGECDPLNLNGELDTETICGAMETIFRYCLDHYPGKPVCFVITHKIQKTAFSENINGDTFQDYRDAMIAVCKKYSIPYYDAFSESGLNGWNDTQNDLFLTAGTTGAGDYTHPNKAGYEHFYVPQLVDLFERILPAE